MIEHLPRRACVVAAILQGRLLLEVLRAFYSSDEDYKLVHTFNHDPTKFDFEEVLKKMGHAAAAQAKET